MKILLLNQTFHPDVMATGQYLTELAMRLVERGHDVTVVTSRRAYDDLARQFPKRETWRGVRIYRVASTRFGKAARWRRAADFASFIACGCVRLVGLPRQDVIVALTSPPLISFIGALLAAMRRSRFVYWVMDLNPDEAIAAGWLKEESLAAKCLHGMSRFSLRRAGKVIALDRFMRARMEAKGIEPGKIAVIPPWSHDDEVRFDDEGRAGFRKAHGLEDKFVVMYSGNHSPCHPLDTLLAAARRLALDPRIVFCFVGGGSEFRKIQQRQELTASRISSDGIQAQANDESGRLPNVICLPYQPLEQLAGSLSAADLHVVVMGEPFVGIIHPCKIYNILSVGAPILYLGPKPSHISDIFAELEDRPWTGTAQHGDVDAVVRLVRGVAVAEAKSPRPLPSPAADRFSKAVLLGRLVSELESSAGLRVQNR